VEKEIAAARETHAKVVAPVVHSKLARPQSPVVCEVGDGGFGHVWSELETCKSTKVPIVLDLLNERTRKT
jgi:thiamine pyrophosphate-dependent acetolactate synthase large subunit-like protein